MEFLENLWNTMLDKPYILWSVVACLAALLILLVLLIILGVTKKHSKVVENVESSNENEEIAEGSSTEDVQDEQTEEAVEEETPAEESVEENAGENNVVAEDESVKKPEEESPTEETQEQPVKKTRGRKKKEVKEEPVVVAPVKKTRVVYGKYEVYTDGTSHYYTLKASNGEVLIKSEAYAKRESVLLAIEAIKRNVEVGTISVRQDKHGLYQFVLVAKNHRTLVMSANYATEKRATSASESFKRFASNSPVVELSEIIESNKEEYKPEGVVDKKGGKLSLVTTENGYYYTLKASNGEVLVHSDIYKTLISAENAIVRFRDSVINGKFYIEVDKRENYQFKLFAANGRIVCVGQIYATKALAIASINSVRSFINLAVRIDE